MSKVQSGMMFIPNGPSPELTAGDGFEFTELQTLTECKFVSITPSDGFAIDGVSATVIPAGVALRIRATAFQVSHGALIAYFAKTIDKRANAQ